MRGGTQAPFKGAGSRSRPRGVYRGERVTPLRSLCDPPAGRMRSPLRSLCIT
jgi:hypothetical protein